MELGSTVGYVADLPQERLGLGGGRLLLVGLLPAPLVGLDASMWWSLLTLESALACWFVRPVGVVGSALPLPVSLLISGGSLAVGSATAWLVNPSIVARTFVVLGVVVGVVALRRTVIDRRRADRDDGGTVRLLASRRTTVEHGGARAWCPWLAGRAGAA
ncbi:hypothetical protein SAMN05421812_10714 [Asanoa hainanensis]|uniref:Uncharacterized protein n=1 Tax=Asanoa hainanensis TaxID=560556 RepID=A0A239MY93_9ACTN|nr:hypothetical protein [Asanoa hainanensis]SNT47721.1 hypothetical protein SAMN05421812_10714 [Asanoa hainanensis]